MSFSKYYSKREELDRVTKVVSSFENGGFLPTFPVSDDTDRNTLTGLTSGSLVTVQNSAQAGGGYAEYRVVSTTDGTWIGSTTTLVSGSSSSGNFTLVPDDTARNALTDLTTGDSVGVISSASVGNVYAEYRILNGAATWILSTKELVAPVGSTQIVENAGALSGAPPSGASFGIDTSTGNTYYVSGGVWTLSSGMDIKNSVAEETGSGLAVTAPTSAPISPEVGDTHIEIYDDVVIYFTAIANDWTAPSFVRVDRQIDLSDATLAATDATGSGGTATTAARSDHRHAAQAVSGDANNLLKVGLDGLHLLDPADLPLPTASNAIPPAANDATGAVGSATTEFALEDHKHPAQGVSADANNLTIVSTNDGLHYTPIAQDSDIIAKANDKALVASSVEDDVSLATPSTSKLPISSVVKTHIDSQRVQVLSSIPVDGTTIAYFEGQLFWDSVGKKMYESTTASTAPFTGGAGSVFAEIQFSGSNYLQVADDTARDALVDLEIGNVVGVLSSLEAGSVYAEYRITVGGATYGAATSILVYPESVSRKVVDITADETDYQYVFGNISDYIRNGDSSGIVTVTLNTSTFPEGHVVTFENNNSNDQDLVVNTTSGSIFTHNPSGTSGSSLNISYGSVFTLQKTVSDWTVISDRSLGETTTVETLIFRHDLAGGLFTSLAETESVNSGSANPETENKFSILSQLESFRSTDNLFRFRVVYPNVNSGEEIVWTQTNNPISDKALGINSDVASNVNIVSSTSPNILGDTAGSNFQGFNNSSNANAYYDLSANTSNWWYPIGQTAFFTGNTMPVTQFGGSSILSDLVELYVTKVTVSGQGGSQTVVSTDAGNKLVVGSDSGAFLSDDAFENYTPNDASKEEIWLKIGQSNSVGTDGSGPIDYLGEDAVHPRVFEYSRGVDKSTYRAAPAGELMAYRNPGQDDGSGIGFGQIFGKTRADLNPSIEKVIIINRGVGGTGFAGNRWNPGDDLYTLAVNDLKDALQSNPKAVFKGIVWHQGESDAGQGQPFYESALSAMVSGIRNEARSVAPGRVEGVFVCGTMVETWIAGNEGARRPIDLAHRNVANYITNADFVDFSDLTDNQDAIHFGTNDLREMGKRYARKVQDLVKSIIPSYHLRVQNGEVVDLFGGGGKVFDPIFTVDPVRGQVLDSNNRGFQTSMVLNHTEHTKSGWVNLQAISANYGNFISGGNGTGLTNAHYWGRVGSGQNGSGTDALVTGLSSHLSVGNWVHAILVYDGSTHELYIDGVSIGSTPIAPVLTPPQIIELCTFTGNSSGNQLDAFIDDVVILPYALDATGALNLYNYVLTPNNLSSSVQVNDQTSSGYIDIGNTRIQWGIGNAGAGPAGTVNNFPAPFLNTSYSVVATGSSLNGQVSNIGTKTTTSFIAEGYDINGANNAHQINWQAMGQKP